MYFGVSYAKSNLGKAMLTGLTEMATKYHFTMSYSSFISFSFPFPPHPFPTCPFPCTDCATAILQLKPLCFCSFLSSCQLTQLSAFLASFRPWHPKQQPRQPSRTPLQLMGQIWAMMLSSAWSVGRAQRHSLLGPASKSTC